MKEIEKPVFTKAEIAEMDSARLNIGYTQGQILGGPDFEGKPFASEVSKKLVAAKERLNGTAKKRMYHEEINKFGWARLDGWKAYPNLNEVRLVFGVKYQAPAGVSKVGKGILKKYHKFLGECLQHAGWKGVQLERPISDGSLPDYIIPLNNQDNIKLLYTLSPSIGFHYKSHAPDFETLKNLEYTCVYEQQQMQHKGESR